MANDTELQLRIRALVEGARNVERLAGELGDLQRGARRDVPDPTSRFRRGVDATRRGAARLRGELLSLRGAIAGLGIGLMAREVVRATTELNRIQNTLQVATGSTEAAGEALAFVRAEAERLGLSLAPSAAQFARLSAAARGTALEGEAAREIFTAVAEASTAIGLTADQTAGALNALEQIISKGTVSAEELRGQLGERLPGAFQIAARAMGVTTSELNDLLVAGDLTAEDLLPRLAAELRATFGPQAAAAAGNLQGNLNRLQTAVFDLLAQDDGMPRLNQAIEDFTGTIQDENFQRGFDSLVSGMTTIAGVAAQAASAIGNLGTAIGETLARGIHGADDPLARLDAQMAELLRRRAELQAELDRPAMLRFMDPDADTESLRAELDIISARIEEVMEQRRQLLTTDPIATPTADTSVDADAAPDTGAGGGGGGDAGADAAAEAREQLRALSAELTQQVDLFGEGETAALEYRLTVGDLAEAVARLGPEGEALREQILGQARALEQMQERAAQRQVLEDLAADMREQAETFGMAAGEVLEYRLTVGDLAGAVEALGPDGARLRDEILAQAEALEAAKEAAGETKEELDETQDAMTEFAVQAARSAQSAFSDFLFDPFDDGLDGMVAGFSEAIRRILAEAAAAQALRALLGPQFGETGEIGGLAGQGLDLLAGLFHSGGVVGAGGPGRTVPAWAFVGAPRYHGGGIAGLRPDEMPAILRRGEEVLTQDDPRHRANGGGITVMAPITITARDAQDVIRSRGQVQREISQAIQRGSRRNT